ncbi:MAG: alpha/beta fold hydrolase [Candidatus Melainabacteria bacterium]|nr:alpha/beta fold hydrolase [Candidatus Melainabacteria bacterium]
MLDEGYLDKVYYRFWKTNEPDNATANVFAIHGLGGHSFWFENAGTLLNKNKINLFSFDLPGFGKSKFKLEEITSYNVWLNVTREVLENFLLTFQIKSPVFILGHSMGALLAVLLNKTVKANGWILSVPGFEGNDKTWPLNSFVLPVLFKAVFNPRENFAVPFGPELLTKNAEVQLKVKKDPLRVINLNASIFRHVYFLAQRTKRSANLLNGPVLMLMSGKDMICSNAATERFFDEITVSDKSKKIYTNSFHDLFIEDELEEIVDDITKWIKRFS